MGENAGSERLLVVGPQTIALFDDSTIDNYPAITQQLPSNYSIISSLIR